MFKGRTVLISFLQFTLLVICKSDIGLENVAQQNFPVLEREIDDFVPHHVQTFNNFDWNFWKVVTSDNERNALISPLSVKLGLALLYEGAQHQTANELALALNLPASRPATREIFSELLQSLKEPSPDYILNVGTRLYVDAAITPRQRYSVIAKSFYETDVKNVNFSDTRVIANDANSWARNLTQGNIDKLIEEESRLKDSVLLLASALYFKGTWKNYPFSKDNTVEGNFVTSQAESVKVHYMRTDSYFYFYYSPELNARVLRLPYKGKKYAMYIILPEAYDGLAQLIEKVNPAVLSRIVWHMEKLPVDVKIPKFKFEASSHLEPALSQMGIKEVFTDKAALSGFAYSGNNDGSLYVSDIIHKAGIEVNEEGTSAYATTEIEIGNKNSGMSFYATHPFMFYIEDESTATILYMGKVNNPVETASSGMTTRAPEVASNNNNMINITEANGNSHRIKISGNGVGVSLDDRYNYFNVELVQKLYEKHEGNLIVSPASVKAALMTLIEGTDGRTQQEILSALRLPTSLSIIRSVADRDLATLKNTSQGVELDLANRLWTAKNLRIADDFKRSLQNYYGGDISSIDFEKSDSAVAAINSWVQQKTDNHIQYIVDKESLDPQTKVLITSAIRFKSQWKNAFIQSRTRDRCFQTFNSGCKMVPMMESYETYNYANIPALDAQILQIPYTDDKFSLLLMLPNKYGKEFLDTLSRDLSYTPISLLLKNLESAEIELHLPKFNIESKLNLKQILKQIGIRDLFSVNANMTKALPDAEYYVNDIFQNARIEINEDGTEAAAVTGLTVVPLMASSSTTFRVDRPFLFFVIDNARTSILFSGRLTEP